MHFCAADATGRSMPTFFPPFAQDHRAPSDVTGFTLHSSPAILGQRENIPTLVPAYKGASVTGGGGKRCPGRARKLPRKQPLLARGNPISSLYVSCCISRRNFLAGGGGGGDRRSRRDVNLTDAKIVYIRAHTRRKFPPAPERQQRWMDRDYHRGAPPRLYERRSR
jgi:hypothetical protein